MLGNSKLKSTFNKSDSIDVNPMDGVSNMSDAMLVLAVGIMLALVINWKIDIGQYNSAAKIDKKMEEIDVNDSLAQKDISMNEFVSDYVETGKVYTDRKTGKTYIVVN